MHRGYAFKNNNNTIAHVIDSVTHLPICSEFLKISPVTNIKKRVI